MLEPFAKEYIFSGTHTHTHTAHVGKNLRSLVTIKKDSVFEEYHSSYYIIQKDRDSLAAENSACTDKQLKNSRCTEK